MGVRRRPRRLVRPETTQGSEVGGGELHAEHRRVGAVDLGGVHAEDSTSTMAATGRC